VVERLLPKQDIVGSSPITRSRNEWIGKTPSNSAETAEGRCFISPRTATQQKWILASLPLTDAYTDFMPSRQAMSCAPATLDFSKLTTHGYISWDMVQHYAQIVDDDLLHAHQAHSPIDNLSHLR
jgi:hypothetical protein